MKHFPRLEELEKEEDLLLAAEGLKDTNEVKLFGFTQHNLVTSRMKPISLNT